MPLGLSASALAKALHVSPLGLFESSCSSFYWSWKCEARPNASSSMAHAVTFHFVSGPACFAQELQAEIVHG